MSRLFIFTAADKNARKHLNDSIENPIDHSIIKSHLDTNYFYYGYIINEISFT